MKNIQEKNEEKLNFQEKKGEKTETLLKPISEWTNKDVQKWLRENGLTEKECEEFSLFSGKDIVEFKEEQWKTSLKSDAKGSLFFNRLSKLKEGIFKFLIIF